MIRYLIIAVSLLFIILTFNNYKGADNALWLGLYGFAAMAGFMALRQYWHWAVFIGMAVLYAGAAIYFWPPQYEGLFYDGLAMKPRNVEMARDAASLFGACLFMVFLGYLVKTNRLSN
jgi:hypothetical protein